MLDRTHPEWLSVKARLEEKIETRRGELEQIVDIDRTNFIRGQIAQLRELIADADAPPAGAITPRYGS